MSRTKGNGAKAPKPEKPGAGSSGRKSTRVMPAPKAPKPLDEGEAELFASLYLKHQCNGAAAMRELRPGLTAGAARQQAHRFLQRPEILEAIEQCRESMRSTTILTLTRAQELLTSIALGERTKGSMFPPSAAERIAAIRQLGIYNNWTPQEGPEKKIDETGTLLARIRMARLNAPPIQEATIISETLKLKEP